LLCKPPRQFDSGRPALRPSGHRRWRCWLRLPASALKAAALNHSAISPYCPHRHGLLRKPPRQFDSGRPALRPSGHRRWRCWLRLPASALKTAALNHSAISPYCPHRHGLLCKPPRQFDSGRPALRPSGHRRWRCWLRLPASALKAAALNHSAISPYCPHRHGLLRKPPRQFDSGRPALRPSGHRRWRCWLRLPASALKTAALNHSAISPYCPHRHGLLCKPPRRKTSASACKRAAEFSAIAGSAQDDRGDWPQD